MDLDLGIDPGKLEFHDPWLLLLAIPALALLLWSRRRHGRAPALLFPSVSSLKGLPRTWRWKALVVVPVLQALSLLCLVVAAARPREGDSRTVIQSKGIAIQMVLDRSSSMEEKMRFGARQARRIEIVKQIFQDFVAGGEGLPGRRTDLIGLTTFARFTEESCPLVSGHEPLLTAVENLGTVEPLLDRYDQPVPMEKIPPRPSPRDYRQNPLNATAIGDGLMRAVYSLVTAEEDLERGEDEDSYEIEGKVVILLTDGEDNASQTDPVQAGRFAAENGIRVYYVLMQELQQYGMDMFGRRRVVGTRTRDSLLELPRKVVGKTGRAFLATDGDALRKIYEEIDRLERTDIGRLEYRSYEEKYHVFLLPALALALLAYGLGETLLRRIP